MPTDTKRKPLSESVQFRTAVGHEATAIEGTIFLKHAITVNPLDLDHTSADERFRMEQEAKRRIRRAIDDKVFGDARLALLRLEDATADLDSHVDVSDPVAVSLLQKIERLIKDVKEELQ